MSRRTKSNKATRLTPRRRPRKNPPLSRHLRHEPLEPRHLLAVVTVNTALDVVDFNDGVTSLREAIFATNTVPGADEIVFDFGHDGSETILLTEGELRITDDLTITGSGAELLTIDAQQRSRIFNIDDPAREDEAFDTTLSGMALTGGRTTGSNQPRGDSTYSGGAVRFSTGGELIISHCSVLDNITNGDNARGGGVHATAGQLVIRDSILSGNKTTGRFAEGGGLYSNSSSAIIERSSIQGNRTTGFNSPGGGISVTDFLLDHCTISGNITEGVWSRGGGVIAWGVSSITNSVVSGNTTIGVDADGGGIVAFANLTVSSTTVSGNSTLGDDSSGGGVFSDSVVELINSTVSGNATTGDGSTGGGIHSFFSLTLRHCTVIDNSTAGAEAQGGGLFAVVSPNAIDHSVVFGNMVRGYAHEDIAGWQGDPGIFQPLRFDINYSFIGTIAPGTPAYLNHTMLGIDPLLGPLQNNGGPTATHALLEGSPAINAGDPSLVGGVPEFDQRGEGYARTVGTIDIGAYEVQPAPGSIATEDLDGDGDRDVTDLMAWQRSLAPAAQAVQQPAAAPPALIAHPEPAPAATAVPVVIVDTELDVVDFNDGVTSLREAIFACNTVPGLQEIQIDITSYSPGPVEPGEILLTEGELRITDDVIITSDLPVWINAQYRSRIFNIDDPSDEDESFDVTLSNLDLVRGLTTGDDWDNQDRPNSGGAIRSVTYGDLNIIDCSIGLSRTEGHEAGGGGIFSKNGELLLTNTHVIGNSTAGTRAQGGGIEAIGTVILDHCVIRANHTQGLIADGGGIRGWHTLIAADSAFLENSTSGDGAEGGGISAAAARLTDCTIHGNQTVGDFSEGGGLHAIMGGLTNCVVSENATSGHLASGGGISLRGAGLTGCTIAGNRTNGNGADGGGIHILSGATLTNSTVSNNSTAGENAHGGGLFIAGTASISHSTITQNHSASGAGIMAGRGLVTLDHTIVYGNENAEVDEDVAADSGTFDINYSLIGTIAPGTQAYLNNTMLGIDPLLGPLQNNGGPTYTHALLEGSPAINAGDPTLVGGNDGVPEFDQRGPFFFRTEGIIDIGAYEAQPARYVSADFDRDGDVDGVDFLVLQRNYGTTPAGDSRSLGDADGDGDVDKNDLIAWQHQFGQPVAPPPQAAIAATPAVSYTLQEPAVDEAFVGPLAEPLTVRLTADLPSLLADEPGFDGPRPPEEARDLAIARML